MATGNSIAPFPNDIDRDYFGAWLSGFVDGEGCFILRRGTYPRRGSLTSFVILLRADDAPVLELVRSYWQSGHVRPRKMYDYTSGAINRNPQSVYECSRVGEQVKVIIPHFLRFPLVAKKQRDFAVWSEAVQLAHAVSLRHKRGQPSRREAHKWSMPEVEKFDQLAEKLRMVRRFPASVDRAQYEVRKRPPDRGLFDGLD